MHGDNNGLIMPPDIAPYQVVICPMIRKNAEIDTVVSNDIAEKLRDADLKSKLMRDIRHKFRNIMIGRLKEYR